MIEIFSEKKGRLTFKSYRTLFNHIKQIEGKKVLETGETDWDFTVYSPERLSRLYLKVAKILEILFTAEQQEACEKNLRLLEISHGSSDKFHQIILPPDIDVKELKKRWCRNYCVENGYTICEKDGA